jgi:phosphatidylglycerophosphatase A
MAPDEIRRRVFGDPLWFLAYGFGSGLARRAPGTFGTIIGLAVWLLIGQSAWPLYALFVCVAFAASIPICDAVASELGILDPGGIVLDEMVGIWIALFALPLHWMPVLAAFVLFRVLDILKPWPMSWLDRNLKGGLGIMLDDLAAGVITLVVVHAGWAGLNAMGIGI